jgi:ParB/RepB/Spo0J family partition protein
MRAFREIFLGLLDEGTNVRELKGGDVGELMKSMDDHGPLSPLLVVPTGTGRYRVVAGHRRLMALQMLGESHAPCWVRDDISPGDEPFIQLIENTQRVDMDPEELVKVFDKLVARGMTMVQISRRLGKSDGWVWDQYLTARTREEMRKKGKLPEEEIKKIGVTKAIKMLTKKNRPPEPFVVQATSQGLCLRVLCRDEEVLRKVRACLYGFRGRLEVAGKRGGKK